MSAPRWTELADEPAAFEIHAVHRAFDGFRAVDVFEIDVGEDHGGRMQREMLRTGEVAAVLPYDPERDCFVLIRQFRLGAHLANGRALMIECVAGRVEEDEALEAAAARECEEEIGVPPSALHHLLDIVPSPGTMDEYYRILLGFVDSSQVPETAGAAYESERTHPFVVDRRTFFAALKGGRMENCILNLGAMAFALRAEEFVPARFRGSE